MENFISRNYTNKSVLYNNKGNAPKYLELFKEYCSIESN